MSNEPMSREEAMRVAEQLSPLPHVAHRALQTLALHVVTDEAFAKDSKRWHFFVAAMIAEDGAARAALVRQPFPAATQEAWDRQVDAAIIDFVGTNAGAG